MFRNTYDQSNEDLPQQTERAISDTVCAAGVAKEAGSDVDESV